MENIKDFKGFKGMKRGSSLITENAVSNGDAWKIISPIEIPKSIVKAYIKKVKDESGQNLSETFGEVNLAEMIVSYVLNTFTKIENLPSSIALGDINAGTPAQVQPIQPVQNIQAQVQNPDAQDSAQDIPAQEGQTQTQGQGQGQTQGQSRSQGQGQTQSQEI